MTDTYTHVMNMPKITRMEWIQNAKVYGLACTCKSETTPKYCAKHDPRIVRLLKEASDTFESAF